MRRIFDSSKRNLFLLFAMGMTLMVIAATAPAAWAEEGGKDDKAAVVTGVQQTDIDADENRSAKYDEYRDIPEGLVLNYLSWTLSRKEGWLGESYFQFTGKDVLQKDEKIATRFGVFGKLDIDIDWTRTPHKFTNGAKFLLNSVSPGTYRIADEAQMRFQDPDGDGVWGDTATLPAVVDDFVSSTGFQTFGIQRNEGRFGLRWTPVAHWSFNLNAVREKRNGYRPLGSGTYLRTTGIADPDGVGTDSIYPVRGLELPEPIDYTTTMLEFGAKFTHKRFFAGVAYQVSDFENNIPTLTYDNPFWFNDCNASGGTPGCPGSPRFMVEEGRMDLYPDNDSRNLVITGGVFLPMSTQFTATLSRGTITQDDDFLPWTTNTALIGVADINGDTVIDATDDPTTTALLPRKSLDGEVDTTAMNLVLTSRPWKPLTLTAKYRTYDYDSTQDPLMLQGYVRYVESYWGTTFNNQPLEHRPLDFQKTVSALEASLHPWKYFGALLFFQRSSWDYDQYTDLNADTVRDIGTRAVKGTDDDTMGATLFTNPAEWMDARVTYKTSKREFDGTYTTFAAGEHQGVRQYDIFERDRTEMDVQVNLMPVEKLTIGLGYRSVEDDYADTLITWDSNTGESFGFREGEDKGFTFTLYFQADKRLDLFVYMESSEMETLVHGQTKYGTFANLNNTWFTEIGNKSTAYGVGSHITIIPDSLYLDANLNRTQGEVSHDAWNPIATGDSNSLSAKAYNFPDQVSKLTTGELRLMKKLSARYGLGFSYLYEKFDLEDFQWDVLVPYGNDFVSYGDDALRYLFLDSRYNDYSAHIAQLFLKIKF
ncbi:MAG: MtrB/PioB family outer membrane beta-barrel protein [Acidobacteriota bacterium]